MVKKPCWSYFVTSLDPEPVQEAAGDETEAREGKAEVDGVAGNYFTTSQ